MPSLTSFQTRARLLAGIGVVAVILCLVLPPIAQPQGYHGFADQRGWLGIPNFGDVVSNLAFLWVALLGLWVLRPSAVQRMPSAPRWAYRVMFAGLALTAFGSAYYHWAPSDARLVWDRLPMTLVFMPLLAATLAERLHWRSSLPLLGLSLLGLGSVWFWHLSGNLLPYFVAQGGSILLILLTLAWFPSPWTGRKWMLAVFGSYAVAFLCEQGDKLIFQCTAGAFSGHTCKHLAAALAFYFMARMLRDQHPQPVTAMSH